MTTIDPIVMQVGNNDHERESSNTSLAWLCGFHLHNFTWACIDHILLSTTTIDPIVMKVDHDHDHERESATQVTNPQHGGVVFI